MHKIYSLQANLKKINTKLINRLIFKEVRKNEKEIIKLAVEQQKLEGERADGAKISPIRKPYPVYSQQYTKYKKSKGLQTRFVDLELTGKYHKSFRLEYNNNFVILLTERFEAGFNIVEQLKNMYGTEIEGWNSANKDIIIEIVTNFVKQQINSIINGM